MKKQDSLRVAISSLPPPKLSQLNLADLPHYPEESYADPFGGQGEWLAQARRDGLAMALELTMLTHRRRVAVTIPHPPPGTVHNDVRPWRSVADLEAGPPAMDSAHIAGLVRLATERESASTESIIDGVQRLIVSSASTQAEAPEVCELLATLIEHLGYVVLSQEFNARHLQSDAADRLTKLYRLLGRYAADMHSKRVRHGDLHLGNFAPNEQGELLLIDAGSVAFIDHVPSAQERAQDLGLLKLTCHFEHWEAVKLGYREVAGAEAKAVFELL